MSHQDSSERAMSEAWAAIVGHYEKSLKQFGPTPRGADWPNGADLAAHQPEIAFPSIEWD
jgi:hypothetical protein